MRRHRFILACLAGLSLISVQPGFAGGKDKKREEAAALLTQAAELSNLRSPESPPFRLRARAQISGRSKERADGSYLLVWASPEQWREEITFPGFSQVRVVKEGKLWQRRSVDYLPLRIYHLTQALDFQSRLKLKPGQKIDKIRERKRNGTPIRCVKVRPDAVNFYEFCFDPADGFLVCDRYPVVTYEYTDHVAWESKIFPRTLRVLEYGKPVVEVWVEELKVEPAPAPSLFLPLSNAEVQIWCENPEPARALREGSRRETYYFLSSPATGIVSIYAVIGEDGKLHNLTLLRSVSHELAATDLDFYKHLRFRPEMCNGVPVKHEIVFEVKH